MNLCCVYTFEERNRNDKNEKKIITCFTERGRCGNKLL